jgi:hypothetical protein
MLSCRYCNFRKGKGKGELDRFSCQGKCNIRGRTNISLSTSPGTVYPSSPLEQIVILPHTVTKRGGHAQNGRSRVVILNKTAAINAQVIPLPKFVYDIWYKIQRTKKTKMT